MAEDDCASARAQLHKEFEDIWTHVDNKCRHEEATSLLAMRSTMDRMWEEMKTNREKQRLELQTAFNEKLRAAAEPPAQPQQQDARARDEAAGTICKSTEVSSEHVRSCARAGRRGRVSAVAKADRWYSAESEVSSEDECLVLHRVRRDRASGARARKLRSAHPGTEASSRGEKDVRPPMPKKRVTAGYGREGRDEPVGGEPDEGQKKRQKKVPALAGCAICFEHWSDTVHRHGFVCGHALLVRLQKPKTCILGSLS